MFSVLPPEKCERGVLEVHVLQRSSGAEAIVEFSLDPTAAGVHRCPAETGGPDHGQGHPDGGADVDLGHVDEQGDGEYGAPSSQ